MRELSLFTGIGGGLLASRLLGWQTVCGVEIDEYCRKVLKQRQIDGHLDQFPIYDDIRRFDGTEWLRRCDVVSGGFPCQNISSAGKREGLEGDRSRLWFEMLRIIEECKPAYVFAENSPMLRTRGLPVVLKGLADLGFDAAWGVLGAWHVGAPHRRNRMWIVASNSDVCRQRGLPFHAEVARASELSSTDGNSNSQRQRFQKHEPSQCQKHQGSAGSVATTGQSTHADLSRLEIRGCERSDACEECPTTKRGGPRARSDWWTVPSFEGVDDVLPNRMDRTRATGNGQVSTVAQLAWEVLGPK